MIDNERIRHLLDGMRVAAEEALGILNAEMHEHEAKNEQTVEKLAAEPVVGGLAEGGAASEEVAAAATMVSADQG